MMYRTFIAIPVTDKIIKAVESIKERLKHLPFRWTAPENTHLTLVFLGNISEQGLENAKNIVQKVGEQYKSFSIEFIGVVYGPVNRPPRMIWLRGEPSQELIRLVSDLERELSQDSIIRYNPTRPFREAHLTLARRKENRENTNLPKLKESLSSVLPVNRIELITSELRPDGPKYTVVKETFLQ